MKKHATRPAVLLLVLHSFFFAPLLNSQDVILQGFYWNTHPGDVNNTTSGGIWWDTLATVAPEVAAAGFRTVWTPPPTKSFAGVWDMGYGMYDYFDLGEYLSKGTTRTRHGSRGELDAMIAAMHNNGLLVMADVVLNHRGGADGQAMYQVGGNNGFTIFTPPSGRITGGPEDFHPNNQHPDQDPDYHNPIFFEDVCYFNEADSDPPTNPDGTPGSWFFGAPAISGSMGDSLIMWGRWLVNDVGYDELRLDAVKHIDPWYVAKFLVETKNGTQPFAIGESFDYGLSNLANYHNAVETSPNSGTKPAKISLFDFPLRGALKSVLNNTSGSTDLYQTLGGAGLVWGSSMTGFDVVTWLESHDTDREGYVNASSGCPIPYGSSCLELHTESDHDPVFSDKEDMGYPFLMAAEGRPVVFWKDWYWYGLSEDIKWQMALRETTATGSSDHIQNMGGSWPTDPPYDGDNHGGNMFAMRRDGLSGGVSDGMVLGLNDDDDKEHAVYVNTPFTNKYLKDYSDGYLFQTSQTFGDSRALIKAQPRDYSWWSVTGLYPKPAGAPASHFGMDATPGGCPHFIAICAADAGNLIVNGAPIAIGDEVAVKNAAGQVVGIGRIGQGFRWDGMHDMIIEALGAPSANGLGNGETFRMFVYDQSAGSETEIGTVQYAAAGTAINFSPERPGSPNRNGNFSTFSVNTNAAGAFQCAGISRIVAFNSQVAVSQPFCTGDAAGNADYNSAWANGSDGGSGMGAWQLSPASNSGSSGFFVGNSATNGDGDGNSDGDINTAGRAWGMYANSGAQANAVRTFDADWPAGTAFSLAMDNGYIDNGNTVGFGLQNSAGENLLEFYFVGGTSFYQYNDLTGAHNTGTGFTDEGLSLEITLTSGNTYQLVVTALYDGASATYSGSLKSPTGGQAVHQLRLFNANAGGGGQYDAFFNSIGVCYPATIVINEVDYDQVDADEMEFVELKNISASAVNLDAYTLELVNGSSGAVYATVDLPDVNLAPGDYFVICGNGSTVPNCDFNFTGALADRIQNGAPDAMRLLLNNSIIVDALSYEGSVSGAVEGSGTGLTDNNTTAGVGLSRIPDGNDSDQNNSDFKLSCITPGTANVDNANSDGDTYPDLCDNCPNDTNEDQADTDEDGTGDVCDACPLAVNGLEHFDANTCNCEPGYFQVTETRNGEEVIVGCQICPAGRYCPDGQNAILCPAGQYSNSPGATECIGCAAGYYNNQEGATECMACLAGTFSSSIGASECTACAEGYYSNVDAATECTACGINTYSGTTGATECLSCGTGFYSPEGANACSMCNLGFTATPSAESCGGAMDGTISISGVINGTGPYMYSIDDGVNYITSATFTGLSAGNYSVRVKDFYNCESDAENVAVADGSCPLTFSGTIVWEHDDVSGVQNATVNLSGAGSGSDLSAADGTYQIVVPLASGNYTIKPVKNINKTNGLSVADAVAIQQHIANINPITDPYKQVAADVNKSNTITALDAVLVNQLLLGNPGANNLFNTSWRFVPAGYALSSPPWNFPEQINLTGVSSDQSGQDFVGIKLGDLVSAFADPANLSGNPPLMLRAQSPALTAGQEVLLEIHADQFGDLAAIQFALRFDPQLLAFESIETSGAVPLNNDHFGLFDLDAGIIRMAWSAPAGAPLSEGTTLFGLRFKALSSGATLQEAIGQDDTVLPGLAYDSDLNESQVELVFQQSTDTKESVNTPVQLLQNRPNPFTGATVIGFVLPRPCEAQLRVLDVSGREVMRFDKSYPAGYSEEQITLEGINGVFYYELTTPLGVWTKRMVRVGE
ncbi:MAG: lamin tail domain-containing protein [Lewinellaceae bacterium]|nr:lamin tail domain-containing protein [Lewinellaceae bacterium]